MQKREDKPGLPTVLLVHGGPWARDVWGFHPYVAWLTNRGYAVLQCNFRCASSACAHRPLSCSTPL